MELPRAAAIDAVAYRGCRTDGGAFTRAARSCGSQVWNDRLRFFEAMVRDAPRSARSHRELGLTYGDLGRYDRALEEMHTSLEIEP